MSHPLHCRSFNVGIPRTAGHRPSILYADVGHGEAGFTEGLPGSAEETGRSTRRIVVRTSITPDVRLHIHRRRNEATRGDCLPFWAVTRAQEEHASVSVLVKDESTLSHL